MSETEQSRREEEGEHPEVDRAYEREDGGQVPDGQAESEYPGPDPKDDRSGDAADDDQGI